MGKLQKLIHYVKINILLPIYQKILVYRLRHKKHINVVFIAFSLPMWRYQHIYDLLSKHPRFNVSVIIIPTISYSKEQQEKCVNELSDYFAAKNVNYQFGESSQGLLDIKSELSPDILFYPQPYLDLFSEQFRYDIFRYRLLCYYPYAFWTATDDWSYNLPLHNYAWKLFYSTELHRDEARNIAFNRGRNVEVVGYPNADNFVRKFYEDVWKSQKNRKKRIIWAPHFTISSGGLMKQSNFLWMAELMLELTKKYSDTVQFAFKPHPRLYSELCRHQDWGEEKTRLYYNEWANRSNTQIETGEYIDLFMTSDAMIHDCGSFSVEYHYSSNPVMFVSDDFEALIAEKGKFGQLAMRQHYIGANKDDIIDFIDRIVIGGQDTMAVQRKEFVKAYMIPPKGKSVAENTMDILLKELC
ncbi:MAG: CDP-glycerol glycerophosphotransferase family protein [Alistipes sp.]|nr:CDP-glycerol glycerophosphotransferase family protein [Alistipes sp.]